MFKQLILKKQNEIGETTRRNADSYVPGDEEREG